MGSGDCWRADTGIIGGVLVAARREHGQRGQAARDSQHAVCFRSLFSNSVLSWWNVLPDVASDCKNACQSHQFFLALQGDGPFDHSTFKRLAAALAAVSGAALLQHCRAEFTRGSSKSKPSLLQREIADTVGVVFAREYPRVQVLEEQVLERGGGYSVDIQLVNRQTEGLSVVVEVDGPSHFLRVDTDSSTLATNGSTRLKHRILEAMGLHVSYRDWDGLRDSTREEASIAAHGCVAVHGCVIHTPAVRTVK